MLCGRLGMARTRVELTRWPSRTWGRTRQRAAPIPTCRRAGRHRRTARPSTRAWPSAAHAASPRTPLGSRPRTLSRPRAMAGGRLCEERVSTRVPAAALRKRRRRTSYRDRFRAARSGARDHADASLPRVHSCRRTCTVELVRRVAGGTVPSRRDARRTWCGSPRQPTAASLGQS